MGGLSFCSIYSTWGFEFIGVLQVCVSGYLLFVPLIMLKVKL